MMNDKLGMMTALFKKLNFKNHTAIVAINYPKSFEVELYAMKGITSFVNDIKKAKEIDFAMLFVTKQKEIDVLIKEIYTKLNGDAVLWFCYPKGTSKKYTCDFNRDTGWKSVAKYELEPVRMVAIDEDWSALRFRNVAYIKKITRRESHALTKAAKERTTLKGK
jgi:hypothetical protein